MSKNDFPTGMGKMRKYLDDKLKEMLEESREAFKHSRKLGRVMGIVADHRLQRLQHFQAVEQLATWRRAYGYNRIEADDNQRASRPLSLTPEQFTQSLWSELNALKDADSMPEGDIFSPRAKSFIKEIRQGTLNSTDAIEQSTANMTDEELAILKRLAEKQDHEAAQVTVTPVSTAQHCIPRSLNPEIPSDVYLNMEEKDEGRMNPELTEFKPSSAGTGIETPGLQCPPNGGTWETGRTIADGYLLVDRGSNQRGDIYSPKERVGTRAGTATTPAHSPNTIFPQQDHKPRDKTTSKENKQLDPGGKGEKPPLWNAAVIGIAFFLFWGELWAMRGSLFFASCSLFLCACLTVLYSLFYQVTVCQRAGRPREETRIKSLMYTTGGQAFFLPIDPSRIITTVFGSMHRMPWE